MQRIRDLRLARGETQQALASALGMDRTTIAKYESGASEPSVAILLRLAAHYGVTVDYLVGATDSPGGQAGLSAFAPIGGPSMDQLTGAEREELAAFAQALIAKRKKR